MICHILGTGGSARALAHPTPWTVRADPPSLGDITKENAVHTLVVYCHPRTDSLNHAVLEALLRRLDREGRGHEVIDLYADGFDPALSADELAGYNDGTVLDPHVRRYQELLAQAEHLAIVCPVWWNDVPAMLRGFFDKVMLVGFSWEPTGSGLLGKLTNLSTCDLYTTSDEDASFFDKAFALSFVEGTLAQLGIGGLGEGSSANRRWHHLGSVATTTPEQRAAWLREVEGH